MRTNDMQSVFTVHTNDFYCHIHGNRNSLASLLMMMMRWCMKNSFISKNIARHASVISEIIELSLSQESRARHCSQKSRITRTTFEQDEQCGAHAIKFMGRGDCISIYRVTSVSCTRGVEYYVSFTQYCQNHQKDKWISPKIKEQFHLHSQYWQFQYLLAQYSLRRKFASQQIMFEITYHQ